MMMTSQSFDRGLRKTIDWKLVFCYLAIIFIGWISIYAAESSAEPASIFDPSCRSGKQFIWMMVVFAADIIVLFMLNPKIWELLTPWLYTLVLALLVLVIFVSEDTKGSHSWFALGPIKFQPAEVSKITTSLMLAMIMGRSNFKLQSLRSYFQVGVVLGLPMLAILGESETGSALVYLGYILVLYREGLSGWWLFCFAMCVVLFILTLTTSWWISCITVLVVAVLCGYLLLKNSSGMKRRRMIIRNCVLGVVAGVLLVFATGSIFNNVLQDHQRSRIEVLLGMKEDPHGVGYNVRQSMIAIGSGGLTGKGFLNGTQTTFGFVPEQSTDFIFCTIGEEWGFLGCIVVILLYVFMIYRIVQDADKCRGAFTRIYGQCVAACLFVHLFINIGMTIGIMPVIGIPLPMISYGGSSLLAFSMLIFIFLALNRQENKYF